MKMSLYTAAHHNHAQTLERSYLLRINGKVVERPQQMLMRVAVGIHKGDINAAIETYNLLSDRWFTHASPTLFNAGTVAIRTCTPPFSHCVRAGTPRPQLSSCFLVCMKNDSIEGIYDTLKECAVISKSAGGCGCTRCWGCCLHTHSSQHRPVDPQHPCHGELHPWHQRHVQRHHPHAPRV